MTLRRAAPWAFFSLALVAIGHPLFLAIRAAVERYRSEHARAPDRRGDLVPQHTENIPVAEYHLFGELHDHRGSDTSARLRYRVPRGDEESNA
jgi:hypothetical protein